MAFCPSPPSWEEAWACGWAAAHGIFHRASLSCRTTATALPYTLHRLRTPAAHTPARQKGTRPLPASFLLRSCLSSGSYHTTPPPLPHTHPHPTPTPRTHPPHLLPTGGALLPSRHTHTHHHLFMPSGTYGGRALDDGRAEDNRQAGPARRPGRGRGDLILCISSTLDMDGKRSLTSRHLLDCMGVVQAVCPSLPPTTAILSAASHLPSCASASCLQTRAATAYHTAARERARAGAHLPARYHTCTAATTRTPPTRRCTLPCHRAWDAGRGSIAKRICCFTLLHTHTYPTLLPQPTHHLFHTATPPPLHTHPTPHCTHTHHFPFSSTPTAFGTCVLQTPLPAPPLSDGTSHGSGGARLLPIFCRPARC